MEKPPRNPAREAAREALQHLPSADGKTTAEYTQERRDQLAHELRGMRRQRDSEREASKKMLAKVRSALGLKDGAVEHAAAADDHERRTKHHLSSEKDRIRLDEEDRLKEQVRTSVLDPIAELMQAKDPVAIEEALSRIRPELIEAALTAGVFDREVSNRINYALNYSPQKVTVSLATILLKMELQGREGLAGITPESRSYYFFPEVLAGLTEHEQQVLIARLERTPDELRKLILRGNVAVIDRCLLYGTEKSREILNQALDSVFSSATHSIDRLLAYREGSPSFALITERFDQFLTKAFGISYTDLGGWKNYGRSEDGRLNLPVMFDLENARPGSVARLSKRYGISEFARYPQEMLLAQIDEEGLDQPYGIIVFPQEDHNEAFDQKNPILAKLFSQTRGHHGLKVFEADGVYQLTRHLVRLGTGPGKHKISFAVFGAHGEPEMMLLGMGNSRGSIEGRGLTKKQLASGAAQRVKEFFEPDAQIVLLSCSTGVDGGIGQEISRTLGARVIAPTTNTAISDIALSYTEDGTPTFKVAYHTGTANAFQKGSPEAL